LGLYGLSHEMNAGHHPQYSDINRCHSHTVIPKLYLQPCGLMAGGKRPDGQAIFP